MNRRGYDEIKEKFNLLLNCWEQGSSKNLDQCLLKEAACYMSIEESYPEGGRHGIFGISDFLDTLPETKVCHIVPYNFVARVEGEKGQQSTVVCGIAGRQSQEQFEVCEFCGIFSNEWILTESGWMIKTLRLDVQEATGTFKDYYKDWHFEEEKSKWYAGMHLPVISGELDNPWKIIVNDEIELSEEEAVLETFYKYAFGVDFISFDHLPDVLEDDCIVNMAPFGAMDKREFIQTLKVHRCSVLHWFHPARLKSITIYGDKAELELYRMGGHRQRHQQVVYTEANIDRQYACARYELQLCKNSGRWQIYKFDYFLGIIDLGEYKN